MFTTTLSVHVVVVVVVVSDRCAHRRDPITTETGTTIVCGAQQWRRHPEKERREKK